MKPLLLCTAALPLLAGCAGYVDGPSHVDFRAAVGADDWPLPATEPLAVPVLDEPATAATREEIAAWCKALGSDDPAERDRASGSLVSAGNSALPALVSLRASDDAEVAARASELVERILFGDVERLRFRLHENFEPGSPIVMALEERLDRRMEAPAQAKEILKALAEAGRRGGLGSPTGAYVRGMMDLMGILAGVPGAEGQRRRRVAGYDDPGDPVALNAFARIVRFALHDRDSEVRREALRALATLSVGWEASLFGELAELKRDPVPEVALMALEILASAARDGANAASCPSLSTFEGPPVGPTNVAAALAPYAPELFEFAADPRNPVPARICALEAASYSGDAGLVSRILKMPKDPEMELAVFHALVALGGPEAEQAIVGVLTVPSERIPTEDAETAAARRGTRAVVPILATRPGGRARACAVIGAVAGPEHGGTLVDLLGRQDKVEEIRPLLGAVVRHSPLPGPDGAAARDAIRRLLASPDPDLRFLAACALSAINPRDGIAAWGGLLHDSAEVNVTWKGWLGPWAVEEFAAGGLEKLTGISFNGDDWLGDWRDWWEEHHSEYEEN